MDNAPNPSNKTQRQLRKQAMLQRLQEIKLRMARSKATDERTRPLQQSSRHRDDSLLVEFNRDNPLQQLLQDAFGSSKDRLSKRRSSSAPRTSRIVVIFVNPSRRRRTRLPGPHPDGKPRNGTDRKSSRLLRNDALNSRFDLQSLLSRGRITLRITVTLLRSRTRNRDKRKKITDIAKDDSDVKINHSASMSIQNLAQHPPNPAPMESISTQYESSGSMSMWEALVQVATQRYEELLQEERRQKERHKQATTMMVGGQCDADQQSSDQSATLIRSAEISIAENVTVGGEEEDEEDPGRLVIDESATDESKAESVVDQVVPASNGIQEQEQHVIQQQRETVIQPCRSSSVHSEPGHNGAAVPDQGESPQVRLPAATLTTGVRPIRQPKHMSQVTFNRFMPYQIPMSYNKNMARKFPGAECRTPEQQAVREKNTIAARQSRAKMRMMDEMLQQEASNEKTHNHYMKERMAGLFTYANVLRDKIGLGETDFLEEFERVKQDYVPGPMRTHYVRNLSRSGQENGENGPPSPFGLNGHVASPGESDVTLNEKLSGSETDSAPEPDGTVLDLSVKSKRDRSLGNGVF